jgi:BirA family biotin operon repressor/biotin-[acetyl-CoA-carboxylase] ligase
MGLQTGWHRTCIYRYNEIMMNRQRLEAGLPVAGIGKPLYVYSTIGSTNEEVKTLAEDGAPHGTLVVADGQSSGKGRKERQWYSEPGSGLALSLLLRPGQKTASITSLTALGALAVVEAIAGNGVEAKIKWPNDVIVEAGKLAGILVETSWSGNEMAYAVVGIGVNVHRGAIPNVELDFPATCVDDAVGSRVSRERFMLDLLASFAGWYEVLGTERIVEAWEQRLAYKNQEVSVFGKDSLITGLLTGLAPDGRLVLEIDSGETVLLGEGDLSLRPIDSDKD